MSSSISAAVDEHGVEEDEKGIISLFPCKHKIPTPGMVMRGVASMPVAFAGALATLIGKLSLDPNAAGTHPTVFLKYAGGLGAIFSRNGYGWYVNNKRVACIANIRNNRLD